MLNVTRSDLPPLDEYVAYLKDLWSTHWLTNDGALCRRLEQELRARLGLERMALVSNGTVAIQLALQACGAKGEVVTTPFTFPATSNAILMQGMRPVFADVDPATYCLDAGAVEDAITSDTSAILGVHVYGNPCDDRALRDVAERHGLRLIYDAAHAFGVEQGGKTILDWGDASTLSFHATKVYHTVEGGAVVSRYEDVDAKVRLLRNHGITSETTFADVGTNAKLNEFEAAMGLANLPHHDARVRRRGELAARYRSRLGLRVQWQRVHASRPNHAYLPVVFPSEAAREGVVRALGDIGVKPRRYFFPLASSAPFYGPRDRDTPVAEDLARRVLCLPLYPDLADRDVDRICDAVLAAVA